MCGPTDRDHEENASDVQQQQQQQQQQPQQLLPIDTSSPVLVTGATGYVAGVLIQQLLELGVTVHATVRDPTDTARLQYLMDLPKRYAHGDAAIKLFRADLLEEGSFAEGMKGCSIVFHTASPVIMKKISNPQRDLVDPAVRGTLNVLREATNTTTVQRVVLTSSCAAIYCDATDTYETANHTLTEDDWNRNATLEYYPYAYSKTKAERMAWEYAGSTRTNWSLVVINPCVVMGPGITVHENSDCFQLLKRLGGGGWQWGCPNVCKAVVDVRDVARAHIAAAYSAQARGRYIVAGTNTSFDEMATVLQHHFPSYPIAPWTLPKLLVWLAAPYVGVDRRFILNNVNIPVRFDNSKSKRDLGITYRPLSETLQDMFQQLIDQGVVAASKRNPRK